MKLKYNKNLYALMQNIIYPIMFIVFLISFFHNYFTNAYSEEFSFFNNVNYILYNILLLYLLSFLIFNEKTRKLKVYNIVSFLADSIRTILLFYVFINLMKNSYDIQYLTKIYFILIWLPIANLIWAYSLKLINKPLIYLNVGLFILLFFAGIYSNDNIIFNYLLLFILIIIITYELFELNSLIKNELEMSTIERSND